MLTRLLAHGLMAIVPEKCKALIRLGPDAAFPITVEVFNAWLSPMDVSLSKYGHLNLQGDETRINIPQVELNPSGNGREIRARDQIVVDGISYLVLSSTLKSVRTRWECIVRKAL